MRLRGIRFCNWRIALGAILLALLAEGRARATSAEYSLLVHSMAPNAGGQEAYSMRAGNKRHETSLFVNRYLLSGDFPLVGATYAKRLTVCGDDCWFWRMYTQIGVGISTAGPLLELTWSVTPLSFLRIDVTTQAFATRDRLILWGYPLWFGVTLPVSLPFFW